MTNTDVRKTESNGQAPVNAVAAEPVSNAVAVAGDVAARPKQGGTRGPKAVDWGPAFLAALVETGQCSKAAEAAGVSYLTVWRRRKARREFEEKYQEALEAAAELLEAEAVRRARMGVRKLRFNTKTGEPYKDPATGEHYVEHEYSDTLLLALLKRFLPKHYRERTAVEDSGREVGPVLSEEVRRVLMAGRQEALRNGKSGLA